MSATLLQNWQITMVVALVMSCSSQALCQSQPGAAFYEKNYAEAPNVAGKRQQAPESSTNGSARSVSTGGSPSTTATSGSTGVGEDAPKMQVYLYVNSKDKAHFNTAFRKALKLQDLNRYAVVRLIAHVGDYRNVTDEMKQQAAAKKILLVASPMVPTDLGVTESPVWILDDGTSQHIVEGLMNPESCIDSQGAYREPEKSIFESKDTPAPAPKVEGF